VRAASGLLEGYGGPATAGDPPSLARSERASPPDLSPR